MLKKIILLLVASVFSFAITFFLLNYISLITSRTVTISDHDEFKLEILPGKHFNKLMIVSHPDDETIFGGVHLLNDEYVVVCVTCGSNPNRLKEFKKAMSYTEDKYIYLGHPDVVNGYISNWENDEEKIKTELADIIYSRDWDLVVTHNPNGEYGHKHHKKVNKIVTSLVNDKSKLNYFGIWHTKDEVVDSDPDSLEQKTYEEKEPVLSIYKSQRLNGNSRYLYMFKNENWIKYEDWNY